MQSVAFKTYQRSPFSATRFINGHRQYRRTAPPALIDFTADWCVSCRVIEREVSENDAVLDALNWVDLIKVDMTRSTLDARALMQRYGVVSARKLLASLERVGGKT